MAKGYQAIKDYEQAALYWKKAADLYGRDSKWGRKALKKLDGMYAQNGIPYPPSER
ncbi:hypothetical protein ACFL49_03270 [Candidatus Omnitrophota bacterium]